MASEKRASEGIALLSMYGDEDDEMEDLDDEEENRRQEDVPVLAPDAVTVEDNGGVSDYGNENFLRQQEDGGLNENSTQSKSFNKGTSSASSTPQLPLFSPQLSDFNLVQSQKNRPTIVDYGHEEGAISPEHEDGEIPATGRVTYGELLHPSDGDSRENNSPGIVRFPTPRTQATPPQSLDQIDQSESDAMSHAVNESESLETEDAVMVSVEEQKDVDPLDEFLSPPPKAKCSEELQEKIIKFLALKKSTGRSFNAEVRNRKEFRNPDFLLHAVTYQDIDQIGSCFHRDVFYPHGYDKSDFYDEIEADMRRETERKEQERKKTPKIDFSSGGIQPGNVVPTPKISVPTPGLPAVAGGLLNVTPATLDVTARDGRQNKKSKWDKVDVDQRNSAGGQDKSSALSAHAAVVNAAKAGSGYSAFAQQRRKEAEDKRSSDKKWERRS